MDVFPSSFSSFSSLSPAKGIEVLPNPAAARHQTVINEPASLLFFSFSFFLFCLNFW